MHALRFAATAAGRWHRTGLTSAAAECTNLIVKNFTRLGFELRNFQNYWGSTRLSGEHRVADHRDVDEPAGYVRRPGRSSNYVFAVIGLPAVELGPRSDVDKRHVRLLHAVPLDQ